MIKRGKIAQQSAAVGRREKLRRRCASQPLYIYFTNPENLPMLFGANGAEPLYRENTMELLDRDAAKILFDHYRKNRDGIRNKPEMASICLICGSIHIVDKDGEPGKLSCRNCGFSWYRYQCPVCGRTVDGRDPKNPACRECGLRLCTCGACDCPTQTEQGELT